MAKKKNTFTQLAKSLESLPWILKVILALLYCLYGNLIRLFRSLGKKNTIGVILAVILILSGGLLVLWVVDFILVLFNKKIWWID
jgi:uncharacterized membrane protein (DUF485 family)